MNQYDARSPRIFGASRCPPGSHVCGKGTTMRYVLGLLILLLGGCATSFPVPDTLGDPKRAVTYGYHPLDPLPVRYTGTKDQLMDLLFDETMRLGIAEVTADAGVTFGPVSVGVAGRRYQVVVDYLKSATASFGVKLSTPSDDGWQQAMLVERGGEVDRVVPVYIGVGLRLTADLYVVSGSVNLTSLLAIGAAAEAEQVTGQLVVQTLGISGPEISSLVPMPAKLDDSTIQNAILSLGAIRAKMYHTETRLTPRVLGVYNNLGGGEQTIMGFISALLEQPIEFPAVIKE